MKDDNKGGNCIEAMWELHAMTQILVPGNASLEIRYQRKDTQENKNVLMQSNIFMLLVMKKLTVDFIPIIRKK